MSLEMLGAESAGAKETRILEFKAYLNTVSTDAYRSDIALKKAHVYSFATLLNYLSIIHSKYWNTLTETGKTNFKIAKREAELLKAVNAKAKRHQK